MSIFAWVLFGIVNSLILYVFDKNKDQTSPLTAMILGVSGALSGGILAYIIFGGKATTFNTSLLLVILVEVVLFGILTTGKSLRKI